MLDAFSPAVRAWFSTSFLAPTPAQERGWPAIVRGEHTLICAPTGSGKTLTAFMASLDVLVSSPPVEERTTRTRVLYLSPLRALAVDIEKNLRAPLIGIARAADRLGECITVPVVAMRTGDTPANERQRLVRHPPDLLITTPESLYLMLTSAAAETLQGVATVIVDEIHAMAPTKRGAHLALSLERLAQVTEAPFQRIGLSATQRPLEETARFLGGFETPGSPRPVTIVDAGISKPMEVDVVVPIEDMSAPPSTVTPDGLTSGPASAALVARRASVWPSIYPSILERILSHRSTIVFCNGRRQAERLAAALNELAVEAGIGVDPDTGLVTGDLVRAHHGSLAREQRLLIEDDLKQGRLRAIVATSSLELGIDMGAVDHVIQVESPGAVSRGMQRIGRAGHSVGAPSKGTIFPKHRADLLEAAVVARRMLDGEIEHTRYLRNPLDVLAQQIVAHVAGTVEIDRAALLALVRRSAPFAELSDEVFDNTLDMLAGRYPSDEFAELRPRVVWDRVADRIRARDGAKRLAVTSGGTIPDRGLFGVFLTDGARVGELDEEMVYESRPGEVFRLGASTWRIEDITFERVIVSPAPGEPAKMPFWHGDRPGRPYELGQALGAFVRELRGRGEEAAMVRLRDEFHLDALAAGNLWQYLDEQAGATGVAPDDRTIVVERFRDEIGDWRVCVLSPFGTAVHAPWAMAIEQRLAAELDLEVESMYGDDGIVFRLPEAVEELPADIVAIDPDQVDELVMATLPSTSLFSARFREAAGRSLLLPRRRPDRRTPLWQQRQRAADLLAVASKYPSFPVLLETSRECLQDVFDLAGLRALLRDLRSRAVRVVSVTTNRPSPMAQSLLFNWIAAYMYEGDTPLAERRAAALAMDRELLADLLGAEELRELLDQGVIADTELELQRLVEHRLAASADDLHDLLRIVGDLRRDEIEARSAVEAVTVGDWIASLVAERRIIGVNVAGDDRFVTAEDAGRYRDVLGCAVPAGLPGAFTDPVARPIADLIGRYARTHAPFETAEAAARFALPDTVVAGALADLEADGRLVRGEFRPGGVHREWCDVEVLRRIRRRTLAALRHEIEPVPADALGRFLPEWHRIGAERKGLEALVESIAVLAGAPLVASCLDTDILGSRVAEYTSSMLDTLCTAGEVMWVGAGSIGAADGRVRLCFADQLPVLAPAWEPLDHPDGPVIEALRSVLASGGASFWGQLRAAAPEATEGEVLTALWDLVWAGEVTNDSIAPLRALVGVGPAASGRSATVRRPPRRHRPGRLARLGPPAATGRWSLVAPLLQPAVTPTEAAHATALALVERHGVLTPPAITGEGLIGGYSAVYKVLNVLEERGQVRRGYFVEGLGAAQFAMPGAVDLIRRERDAEGTVVVLAATDPAQPYGTALAWPDSPGRPARVASALVVLVDGTPAAWFDRRSRHLVTFQSTFGDGRWLDTLVAAVGVGRAPSVEVRKVDGEPPDGVAAEFLRAGGFVDGYRGLVFRPASPTAGGRLATPPRRGR